MTNHRSYMRRYIKEWNKRNPGYHAQWLADHPGYNAAKSKAWRKRIKLRKRIKYITSLSMLFTCLSLHAQAPQPQPPQVPTFPGLNSIQADFQMASGSTLFWSWTEPPEESASIIAISTQVGNVGASVLTTADIALPFLVSVGTSCHTTYNTGLAPPFFTIVLACGPTLTGNRLLSLNISNPGDISITVLILTGNQFSAQNGTGIQGILPTGSNGTAVFPLIMGELLPPQNLFTAPAGIDVTGTAVTSVPGGTTANVALGNPPAPTNAGEYVIAYYSPLSAIGGVGVIAPWSSLSSSTGQGDINVANLNNYTVTNALVESFSNGGGTTVGVNFIAFAKQPTIGNQIYRSANNTGNFTPVANSTLLVAFAGTGASCSITASDTQGNVFHQVSTVNGVDNVAQSHTYTVLEAFPSSALVDNITAASACAITFVAFDEMRNITPAGFVEPIAPIFSSNNHALPKEDDNGVLFAGNGSFDYTQTTTLTLGTSVLPLWSQFQNGIFDSCRVAVRVLAVSGTTPTLDVFLQDSGDNLGFNDRMHFPQMTVVANFLGAVSGGVGGITPVQTTDGTLAAATKIDGPLSAFGQMKFIVGGTTPSFTIVFNVGCR